MEIILLVVIVLQFAYIVYSDYQNRAERERLTLKVMSKDLGDYVSATEPVSSPVEEEDPYIDISEAGIEQIVNAKER